jgi:hypothetical protein
MLDTTVSLPTFHVDQVRLLYRIADERARAGASEWAANGGGRFKAVRCGRRYGKTTFLETWQADGAIKGWPCGYFAPTYKYVSEVYEQMHEMLDPLLKRKGGHNKTDMILRLRTGGSVEFWTLEDSRAGRSRKYRRAALDEGAFTKSATNEFPKGQAIETWRRSIKPSLGDLRGSAIVASNTNGVDPTNLLYATCNDPDMGFIEHHAPSWVNPYVPERLPGQTLEEWRIEWRAYYRELREREHPLVFAQEYAAEFVDWSGVSLFDIQKMLVDGQPVSYPINCAAVYVIIDTSTKVEKGNDGTAATYFALMHHPGLGYKLIVLDWELHQIEGALLETWLPTVKQNGEALAVACGAINGFIGGFIEDKDSGQVLIQQARLRNLPFAAITSQLTALGKDGRALSVSGYVYRGEVKLSKQAYEKTSMYKGVTRNHFMSQVIGFKMADPKADQRADDILDTFTYGVSMGLGDGRGW